jgi:hypothetical protein
LELVHGVEPVVVVDMHTHPPRRLSEFRSMDPVEVSRIYRLDRHGAECSGKRCGIGCGERLPGRPLTMPDDCWQVVHLRDAHSEQAGRLSGQFRFEDNAIGMT